jgi:hypothetical protein
MTKTKEEIESSLLGSAQTMVMSAVRKGAKDLSTWLEVATLLYKKITEPSPLDQDSLRRFLMNGHWMSNIVLSTPRALP